MVMQIYESNQPGTFQEHGTRIFERERPQHFAGGESMRYVSDRLYLILLPV